MSNEVATREPTEKRRWTVAALIGGGLSVIAAFAALIMLNTPISTLVWKLSWYLAIFDFPGQYFEAVVERGAHGGGDSFRETLFLVVPFNFFFYTLLCYSVMKLLRLSQGTPRISK
jgi:hypothetical protein